MMKKASMGKAVEKGASRKGTTINKEGSLMKKLKEAKPKNFGEGTNAGKKRPNEEKDSAKKKQKVDHQALKPNFKLVESLKSSWNTVRMKSTSAAVRSKLVEEMAKKMEGHILQVTLRHDASRIVESILQFGTEVQRKKILEELASKLVEIAKTPYGHFVVLKAITYCTGADEQRKISTALSGHFVSLGTHVIGARTVESILQLYPPRLTRTLKAEFYGKKFTVLVPEAPRTLQSLIHSLPARKSALLDHMRDLLQKFVDKGLLEFTYVHHLLWEYAQEAAGFVSQDSSGHVLTDVDAASKGAAADPNPAQSDKDKQSNQSKLDDLVSQLIESGPKLMSTRPGAKAMTIVMTAAGAKERKRALKSLKGHTMESLLHDAAFLPLLRLIDVTDDTVAVQKALFDEIRSTQPAIKYTATGEVIGTPLPPLVSIALHRNGSKLLLHLLAPHKKNLEAGDEAALFSVTAANSKKAPAVRRREHLAYLRAPLIQVCAKYVEELARNRSGARVLEDVVRCFFPKSVLSSLVCLFSGQPIEAQEGEEIGDEHEGAMDGDDDEDDEEEGGEDEEEEEDDDGEDDGDDGDDDEEEEDGSDVDGDDDEMLADDDDDAEEEGDEGDSDESNEKKKKGGAKAAAGTNQPPEPPKFSIQEDPVAHMLVRKLLQFEAAAENKSCSATQGKSKKSEGDKGEETDDVDVSLWESPPSDSEISATRLALPLVDALHSQNLLTVWLSANRPSLILADLVRVPSASARARELLKPLMKQIEANVSKFSGATALKEALAKK